MARANVLIVDESRMVDRTTIDTVLKKFLTAPRHPKYLDKPEYEHLAERNKQIFMSSCYFSDSDLYQQAQSYTASFLDDSKKYFICALPYQVSIKENLLSKDQVIDEFSEQTFSDISWMMEMDALFYGCGDENLFKYSELMQCRKLQTPLFSLQYYKDKNIKIPDLEKNEIRILSVDIALMASTKHRNDATAFCINRCYQTSDTNYLSNIAMVETVEGLVADDLGMMIMRYFYKYKCSYLIVDGSGVGQPIVDFIQSDRMDIEYGEEYMAINCCNNEDILARSKNKTAPKAMYVIKATGTTNGEMYLSLRSAFQNHKINLLIGDSEAEEYLKTEIKGYNKMSIQNQVLCKAPYIQTSLLIEELAKLEHEQNGTTIKVKERSGMRKDRVSSLLYNYSVVIDLERKLKPKKQSTQSLVDRLPFRQAKRDSYF